LYERPASRFVADFLGHQNLLSTSFLGMEGSLAVVSHKALGVMEERLGEAGMADNGRAVIEARRGVAQGNSWDIRVDTISRLIAAAAGRRGGARATEKSSKSV